MNGRYEPARIAASAAAQEGPVAYGIVTTAEALEASYRAASRTAQSRGPRALLCDVLTARRARHLRAACWAAVLLAEKHAAQNHHDSRLQALAWSRRARLAYDAYRTAAEPIWVNIMFAVANVNPHTVGHRASHDDPLYHAVLHVQRRWSALPESSWQ